MDLHNSSLQIKFCYYKDYIGYLMKMAICFLSHIEEEKYGLINYSPRYLIAGCNYLILTLSYRVKRMKS